MEGIRPEVDKVRPSGQNRPTKGLRLVHKVFLQSPK